jgi:succinate dehydrogenase / fumarate reductase cytochrome b subunit
MGFPDFFKQYQFSPIKEFLQALPVCKRATSFSERQRRRGHGAELSTIRQLTQTSHIHSAKRTMQDRRPVFFNLMQIQMPVGAITSISHRISGIILALGIPLAIYLLGLSLQGPQGYARAAALFAYPAIKLLAIVFIWALAHHLLAGVRHLLSDIDVGSHLHPARTSAWIVNCAGVAIALLSAGVLF